MTSSASDIDAPPLPKLLPSRLDALATASDVVREALERDKRDALKLAVKARWIALAVVGVLLMIIVPLEEVLYYEVLVCGFALIGWGQLKLGRVGHSRAELLLLFCDLALMTFTLAFPNPFRAESMPLATQLHFNNFSYFYILLAGATLAYSWRTVFAVGTWTTGLWTFAVTLIYFQPLDFPELSQKVEQALAGFPLLYELLDPNSVRWEARIQEIVVFLIVAGILALSGWRANRLLVGQADVERERANLARYFSPNVVDELAQNDVPLGEVRNQDIAVLFVDIVGFTRLAEDRPPQDVIQLLRAFHGRMEAEVFRHHGTLDKYLGDGLMATFGTPYTSPADAGNALDCARKMLSAVDAWNTERAGKGEPEVVASIGIHYGPVVLGDIGANRLEFAVIGSTVNVASRLESLTRVMDTRLLVSDALVEQVRRETGDAGTKLAGLDRQPPREIRGLTGSLEVWALKD